MRFCPNLSMLFKEVDFVERFAILGPASYCVDRLLELAELGVDRLHVIGAHPQHAREVRRRFVAQVMGPVRDQTAAVAR